MQIYGFYSESATLSLSGGELSAEESVDLTLEDVFFIKFNTFVRSTMMLPIYTVNSGYIITPMNERITDMILPATVMGATGLPRVVVWSEHQMKAFQ